MFKLGESPLFRTWKRGVSRPKMQPGTIDSQKAMRVIFAPDKLEVQQPLCSPPLEETTTEVPVSFTLRGVPTLPRVPPFEVHTGKSYAYPRDALPSFYFSMNTVQSVRKRTAMLVRFPSYYYVINEWSICYVPDVSGVFSFTGSHGLYPMVISVVYYGIVWLERLC